jgi:hypothetical protein
MDLFSSFLVVAATASATDAKASNDVASSDGPVEPRSLAEALAILTGPRRDAVAFLISALTSPFLVCAVAAGALAIHLAPSWREILLWGSFTSVLAGVVPLLIVYLMYARGRVGDMHVAERRRRWIPLGACIGSGCLGLLALWAVGAPLQLSALVAAYIVNAVIFIIVSLWWKASVHAAVYVGAFTSCALVVGPWWWTGLGGLPLVIWARARRGRHTVLQGIVGAAIAIVATALTYTLVMRRWAA